MQVCPLLPIWLHGKTGLQESDQNCHFPELRTVPHNPGGNEIHSQEQQYSTMVPAQFLHVIWLKITLEKY